jgi:hypothetical protein
MREQIQGWLDKLRQGTLQAAGLQAARRLQREVVRRRDPLRIRRPPARCARCSVPTSNCRRLFAATAPPRRDWPSDPDFDLSWP